MVFYALINRKLHKSTLLPILPQNISRIGCLATGSLLLIKFKSKCVLENIIIILFYLPDSYRIFAI